MYTVTISKGTNASNQRIFTLTYSNGVRTFEESFLMSSYVSADNVANIANARIAQLTLEDTNFDAIVEGDITPEAPVVDQGVLDKQAYNQKRFYLLQAQQDLSLGLITQDDFDAQVATVQTIKTSLAKAQTPIL